MTTVVTNIHKSRSGTQLSEQYYKEVMERSANYNSRLCLDRKLRLPFLDSQTGVAQNHSNLLMPYRYRGPGKRPDQVYTYPARRWKKKRQNIALPEVPMGMTADSRDTAETGLASGDVHQIGAVENPIPKVEQETMLENSMHEAPHYKVKEYYDEWETMSDPPDAGEIDDRNSDSSDFEETYIKKKRKRGKKGQGTGRGRKKQQTPEEKEQEDKEKPYSCDICGARYKTRPGLSYHLTHSHKDTEREREEEVVQQPPTPTHEYLPPPPSTSHAVLATPPTGPPMGATNTEERSKVSRYCDFCLGDEVENKKTGQKEELVSCADCGRSGHPSCLQFTPNMIISVKKYPWQCIECKSCGLCGTSDNDDQLLFCDDCDRGYHMYCLNPPLSEPPEGSWSCHLCIQEFYGGRKPENME